MPQEAKHGKRYARDMRRIREARNLSVDDLHDETKIPLGLIEAFEDKALFDHPQFNRVYLRSFVRTYAQVVDIDADVALEGLEEALSGAYTGSLAAAYLGEEPTDNETAEATGAEEEVVPPDEQQGAVAREPEGTADDVGAGEEEGPSFVSTTPSTASGFQQAQADEPVEQEEPVDEDWAAQSPPSASKERVEQSRKERASRSPSGRPSQSGGSDRRWMLGVGLFIVVGAIVGLLIMLTGGPEGNGEPAVSAGDTTQVVPTQDTMTQRPAAPAIDIPNLGDTMRVRIVAAQGKVDPIRVTVDEDLRRPYWIEEGDSLMFNPTQRIVIEELLDSVTVKVEGVEYPTSRRDQQGRLVITRDTAQTYFASLQGGQ